MSFNAEWTNLMAVPLLLCGIGLLFAMCAACFYRMGVADWADEKKFLIDSLESLVSENANLRELVRHLYEYRQLYFKTGIYPTDHGVTEQRMRELGVEADG